MVTCRERYIQKCPTAEMSESEEEEGAEEAEEEEEEDRPVEGRASHHSGINRRNLWRGIVRRLSRLSYERDSL